MILTQARIHLDLHKIRLVITSIFILAGIMPSQAQTPNQQQLIVSNVYSFANNILWPNENKTDELLIALYKVSENDLTTEFLKLENASSIRGKTIRIIQTKDIKTVLKSNVVFVIDDISLIEINKSITNQPILIITFESSLKQMLMINLFKDSNQGIKFEINNVNLLNQNLQASQNLTLLGGTEMNISKLFLDNKTSFMNLQSQHERSLDALFLVNELIVQKELQLEKLDKTISLQRQELEEKQHILDQQNLSLLEFDKVISLQRNSLYFLIGLILTILSLLFLGIFAYKMKRDDNKRLAYRSYALQVARDRLEKQKRKAEEANKAKGAFLSLMTHELRTPLQSIIGYTDLVIEGLKSEGDSNYSEQLLRVNTNGERLLELINNTLNLAKIESGKMSVQLTPTHIGTLVDEAVSNIKPLLEKNKNTLNITIDNKKHVPIIDHDKLLQITINLLSNAAKFTKKGQILLSIKNQKNCFTLSVSDTGIGLSEKQHVEIFEQFHQASTTGSFKGQGTGLGLAITQFFCEIMGGSIRVKNNVDLNNKKHEKALNEKLKGTTFIVEIPLPVIEIEKKFMGKNHKH